MPVKSRRWRLHPVVIGLLLVILAWALGSPSAHAEQQAVGEVIYAHGIASAQRPGQEARFVTKGDPLYEGDVVNTGGRGFAVIGLKDGSKMTLRRNTAFAVDKFAHDGPEESMLLRLVKGGVRALTGLVGKRNPQGVRFTTTTATIGIRGTGFDARICDADCAKEGGTAQKDAPAAAQQIVARVAQYSGAATVVGLDGQSRTVTKGTPLFNGDTVRTQKGAYAVLAFRDQSKTTVISESEFRLENVRFTGTQADSGNFIVRVVRGGARVLTGLLAKREPKTVQVNMITAVIGIRGTGFDNRLTLDCVAGACSEAAFTYTWEGAIAMQVGQRSLVVEMGRAGVYNPAQDRLVLLDQVPKFFFDETAPRPDTVDVDFNVLFGVVDLEGHPPGFYVAMRDGHIELAGKVAAIDLGAGEAAYLGEGQDTPVRLRAIPPFLANDPYPAPENFDESTVRLLRVLDLPECRP